MKITAPKPEEIPPYYQTYLKYIKADEDLLDELKKQLSSTENFLKSIPKEKESFRYSEGKWMLKEVVGHLCDTERILSYRALRFSRNDKTPLPGFEENDYAQHSNYRERSLENISSEFSEIRKATIALFENMNEEMFSRSSTANNQTVNVKALLFFIICHCKHHLTVIKERYL